MPAGAGAVGAALGALADLGAEVIEMVFLVVAMGVFLTFQSLNLNFSPTLLLIASVVPKSWWPRKLA